MNISGLTDFGSIKQKILFFGGVALLLVAIAIISYAAVSLNTSAVKNAKDGLFSIAEREAGLVDAVLEEPYVTASAAGAVLSGIRDENSQFPRDDVVLMMQGILKDRALYNGIYTIWEPGAFDNRDAELVLKDGYDKTGRLRIYWYRDAGGSLIRKMYDDTSRDPTDYYEIPKKTMNGVLTEPYIETMQGSPVLMTSVATPIIRDGKFAGIVGVDVTLSDIEKIVDAISIYGGTGKVLVVSNAGMAAGVTGTEDVAGKDLKEVAPLLNLDSTLISDVIKKNSATSFDANGYIGAIVPVMVGTSKTPWAVVAYAPRDIVTAEATAQTATLIIIGILISALGLGVLFLVARSISRPIEEITSLAHAVAEGDLSANVEIHQRDEVGRLADAFRAMNASLLDKTGAAEQIAQGNFAFMIPIVSDQDLLGKSMVRMKEEISAVTSTMNHLSEQAAAGNLAVRGEADRFSGEFRKIIAGVNETLDNVISPVNEAMRLAGEYGQNNFSARFSTETQVAGDFIVFRDAMDSIGVQVSDTIRVIQTRMTELVAGAEETQASADEVANGAAEVATHAEAVSHHADRGSAGADQVLKAMEDLSVTVSDVSLKTEQVSRLAEEGNTLSTEGQGLAKVAEDGMEGIRTATGDLNQMIITIKEQMDQINTVVAMITAISDETNLLALNAAIEAARAGEAGRGFAVVAGEVKELAFESHTSAERIEQMILNLQKESAKANQLMENANHQVESGYTAVSRTLGIFTRIVEMLANIAQNVAEVAAASEEQAAAVEEITASIHEVSAMIKQTAENAISSAAISEESSAAVDQIRRAVESVNGVVTDLQREIQKFTI
ncbi:MAG TPA: methyl-accepting chemotaxis protein [Methanospirillum sp.]|nr:methyl-accepting chemotaxis protein [Methanospirillum sp.]